jgi:hypothetical protein
MRRLGLYPGRLVYIRTSECCTLLVSYSSLLGAAESDRWCRYLLSNVVEMKMKVLKPGNQAYLKKKRRVEGMCLFVASNQTKIHGLAVRGDRVLKLMA